MKERIWLARLPARCIKTLWVKAKSRKEAEEKLRSPEDYPHGDVEGVDVSYKETGKSRIIREIKRRKQ